MIKPTIFFVTDIETTMQGQYAFDVAWKAIDRKGNEYGRGSYIIRETFEHGLVPFYKSKMGYYLEDTFARQITPASIRFVRDQYNAQIEALQDRGHRVILTAYNAAFDFKHLPRTYKFLLDNEKAQFLTRKVELMDIWQHWGDSVPRAYASSHTARASASGRFLSTSAESAYRFEAQDADFIEKHIAWHDVEIESEILVKALARRKKMHIVSKPSDFVGAVWRSINTRLGITGDQELPFPAIQKG